MTRRDVACPQCGLYMRRCYIQQQYTPSTGKRGYRKVPIGYVCVRCEVITLDENVKNDESS
ncbi:MAG: hypothetical protein ACE5L6_02120 [Candidatus Bathyarchaeia archaeon]